MTLGYSCGGLVPGTVRTQPAGDVVPGRLVREGPDRPGAENGASARPAATRAARLAGPRSGRRDRTVLLGTGGRTGP